VAEELFTVNGTIGTTADHDWYKVQIRAGDVLGVAVTGGRFDQGGLNPYARLLDASGKLVIENAGPYFTPGDSMADESPLPRAGRDSFGVEFYRVMPRAGTYYLDVSAYAGETGGQRSGRYQMELMVARPGMESAPRGAKQILFLDFDGATVDYSGFIDKPPVDPATLSPMRDFLEGFNLSLDDEDEVIDAVVRGVKKLLADDVAKKGLNGDYGRKGRAGEFGLEIRNSRDHADTYGQDPFVSRIVIGGTYEESGFEGYSGLAECLDIGNFKTNDQGVATLQWIPDAVDFVSAAAPLTQLDLFADGVVQIAAHEAGHIFGLVHTDDDPEDAETGIAQIMNPYIVEAIGPDLILGSDDDLEAIFGVDGYNENEFFAGVNDTLNALAFGLSTGMAGGRGGGQGGEGGDNHRRGNGGVFTDRRSDSVWDRLELSGGPRPTRGLGI
jgi:hypothetical protein